MTNDTLWNPDVQTLPRDRLLALQQDRLGEAVATAWERPFWRDVLESAGLGPDDVKTAADLKAVPRTVKDDLRRSQAEHPPYGAYQSRDGAVRMGTTTGTSGAPTMVLWTARDLSVEHEGAGRMWRRLGIAPGSVVAHSHPLGIYGGGALLSSALESYGCTVVAVGAPATPEEAERAIEVFLAVKPDRYMMFDAAQVTFREAAARLGVDPEKDLGMTFRAPHPMMQSASATAGTECFSFMGGACMSFKGAHLAEDYAIVEALDPQTGEAVPNNERGRLVVTTLGRDNPMLRYDVEDVVRLDERECRCGETHKRMRWEGRARDIVRAGGRDVLPIDVWWVLEDFPDLKAPSLEYQIVRRPGERDELSLRIEGPASAGDQIAERMRERLEVPAVVEMLERGVLPRFSYKPQRVVDEE